MNFGKGLKVINKIKDCLTRALHKKDCIASLNFKATSKRVESLIMIDPFELRNLERTIKGELAIDVIVENASERGSGYVEQKCGEMWSKYECLIVLD